MRLVIRDGSIMLLSETSGGEMVDVIPYMDNDVEGWVLDKSFNFSCLEGVALSVKNSNHDGPSSIKSRNTVYAYVCNDLDGDKYLNNTDLDTDADGCFDVNEAGFNDPDSDGYLGKDPTLVDSLGMVLSSDGYLTPLDNDNNNIMDFMEAGFIVEITSTPESSYLVKEGDTFSISYGVDLQERFVYQWQVQESTSLFWVDIEDSVSDNVSYMGSKTNTLTVNGLRFDDMQLDNIFLRFRLVISTSYSHMKDGVDITSLNLRNILSSCISSNLKPFTVKVFVFEPI
jgi:hypothetical protein